MRMRQLIETLTKLGCCFIVPAIPAGSILRGISLIWEIPGHTDLVRESHAMENLNDDGYWDRRRVVGRRGICSAG